VSVGRPSAKPSPSVALDPVGLGAFHPRQAHYAFTSWQISGATRIVCIHASRVTSFVLQKLDQFTIGLAKEGHATGPRPQKNSLDFHARLLGVFPRNFLKQGRLSLRKGEGEAEGLF
jgi:hypothetical protein